MEDSTHSPYPEHSNDLTEEVIHEETRKRRFWERFFADKEDDDDEDSEETLKEKETKKEEPKHSEAVEKILSFLGISRRTGISKEKAEPKLDQMDSHGDVEPTNAEISTVEAAPEGDTQETGLQGEVIAEQTSEMDSEDAEQTDTPEVTEAMDDTMIIERTTPNVRVIEAATVPESVLYQRPAENIIHKETIIEPFHGGAVAALFGAEFMSRRRDRKISRRTDKLELRIEEGEKARLQLERLSSKTTEQQRTVDRQQKAFENKPTSEIKKSAISVEKLSVDSETPEARILDKEHIEATSAISGLEKAKEIEERQSERVFEKVTEAAEYNRPIEKVYELRQEVKDEHVDPGASSIGSVIAGFQVPSATTVKLPHQRLIKTQSSFAKDDVPVKTELLSPEYRQAMKMGFWTAVAIITLGLIIYLAR